MAVLRVREPFAYDDRNGVQRVMRVGDLVQANDPLVKGREMFFEPAEQAAARTAAAVETATSAPGEKRSRSRSTKSTESPKSTE